MGHGSGCREEGGDAEGDEEGRGDGEGVAEEGGCCHCGGVLSCMCVCMWLYVRLFDVDDEGGGGGGGLNCVRVLVWMSKYGCGTLIQDDERVGDFSR